MSTPEKIDFEKIFKLIFFLVLPLFTGLYLVLPKVKKRCLILGFYHPNCCDGGGGEKVLWTIIYSLLKNEEFKNKFTIVIYCGDSSKDKDDIFEQVQVNNILCRFQQCI